MAITTQVVEYRDGETQLSGLLVSEARRPGRCPGLLLVHHGPGLDDHAKSHAASFAEWGFVVFACDMYGPGVAGNRERTMATLMGFRDNPGRLCQRARAGLDILSGEARVDGRLAAVGYCFGGMTVLQMARSGTEFAGVVSVHGTLATKEPAQPGVIRAKILVCHGALDPHVPMPQVTQFADEMQQAGADWQLILYGGAMHGFTYHGASALPGSAYNAAADARSTVAIREFFTELFGPPAAWSR
jgi:dienelactone hydrolase